jgi:hypothetical protein
MRPPSFTPTSTAKKTKNNHCLRESMEKWRPVFRRRPASPTRSKKFAASGGELPEAASRQGPVACKPDPGELAIKLRFAGWVG